MAELTFNLKAKCDEIITARKELVRLKEEILKTNQQTSKEVVESLTNAYQKQSQKVKELSEEISRYNFAMKMFGEKILSSKDLVQGFIGKAEETKTKIGEVSSEVDKMQAKEINQKIDQLVSLKGDKGDSLLTVSVNTIMGNVGNIWVAVDEGRTILAQSLMYLQSIDERQERWHKPMLRAFERIDRIADKVDRL